jgi:hypothetical protein
MLKLECTIVAASRKKKIAWGCAAAFVLALLLFVFSARRFLFAEELDVVSIKTEHEYQDAALLERAFALPVASRYAKANIVFQPNGSFCGPTSLANVLRSLDDAGAEPPAMTEGSGKCPLGVCWGGLTLDELADVARHRTQRSVTVLRDLSIAEFRAHLEHSNDPARRYVINFDRGPLFRKVGGHHSPIGGYLTKEDLVLVIDVNASYKPWLVHSERLYAAMDTIDPSSEKKRGLLLIE